MGSTVGLFVLDISENSQETRNRIKDLFTHFSCAKALNRVKNDISYSDRFCRLSIFYIVLRKNLFYRLEKYTLRLYMLGDIHSFLLLGILLLEGIKYIYR
jgi:hypothetical protein